MAGGNKRSDASVPEAGRERAGLRRARSRERPAIEDAAEVDVFGHEHTGAPGDDLDGAAHAFECREITVGRPLDLDPHGAHQAPPCEAPAVGEIEGRAAVQDRLVHLGRTHGRSPGQPEGVTEGMRLLGRQNPAEQAFPGIGRKPAHPHVLAR